VRRPGDDGPRGGYRDDGQAETPGWLSNECEDHARQGFTVIKRRISLARGDRIARRACRLNPWPCWRLRWWRATTQPGDGRSGTWPSGRQSRSCPPARAPGTV